MKSNKAALFFDVMILHCIKATQYTFCTLQKSYNLEISYYIFGERVAFDANT